MIASLGGAIVKDDGTREYHGSGGYVGGLSFDGGNWAYFAGAGKSYHTFTPVLNNIEPVDDGGSGSDCLPGSMCWQNGGGRGVGVDNPPVSTGGGNRTGGGAINPPVTSGGGSTSCLWGECGPAPSGGTTDTNPNWIKQLMAGLTPAPKTNVNQPPVLFSFLPNSNNGGSNMNKYIIVAAIVAVAYFLYKKYA